MDAKPPTSSPPRTVGALRFWELCDRLRAVGAAGPRRLKETLLLRLFQRAGAAGARGERPSLFPLLRLVLPAADADRATYGLRESALADMYTAALSLDPAGPPALRLKHFKQPQPFGSTSVAAGDFSTVLMDVVRRREVMREGDSTLTVDDVNALLDALHAAGDREEKRRVFVLLVSQLSALEHYFFTRIITKDLKVGVGHETLLRLLHPRALDVYNLTSSLQQVSEYLVDPARVSVPLPANAATHSPAAVHKAAEGGGGVGAAVLSVEYGAALKPMLSEVPLHWTRLPAMLAGKRYWLEDKYDGERLLVHKHGSDIRLRSRKGLDMTSRYGYGAALEGGLQDALSGDCIVDAELVSWDRVLQRFVPFGNNRTVARVGEFMQHQLCVIVFDILREGDAVCIDEPLHKRRARLQRIVTSRDHVVELIATQPVPRDVELDWLKGRSTAATLRTRGTKSVLASDHLQLLPSVVCALHSEGNDSHIHVVAVVAGRPAVGDA